MLAADDGAVNINRDDILMAFAVACCWCERKAFLEDALEFAYGKSVLR